jgi:hypothetical protein
MVKKKITEKKQSQTVRVAKYAGILVLALVLIALFLSIIPGLDNNPLVSNVCSASSGYTCSGITISNSGLLSFTLTQNTGQAEYNVTLYLTTQSNGLNTTNPNYTVSIYLGPKLLSGHSVNVSVQLKPDMLNGQNQSTNYSGYAVLSYSNTKNNPPDISIQVAGIIAFAQFK